MIVGMKRACARGCRTQPHSGNQAIRLPVPEAAAVYVAVQPECQCAHCIEVGRPLV